MRLACWLSALALASLNGCTTHVNAPEQSVQTQHTGFEERLNIRYTPDDWPEALHADLYLSRLETPGPAVLVAHGGGWQGRSRDDMTGVARRLASHGFTTMNIDYRFAPEYQYPAQLRDLQQALTWLRDHHRELAIDPDRIAGLGYSSGGHLVSLLAAVASSDHPDRAPWNPDQPGLVAVVTGGLPADLRTFGSGRLLRQLLGGTQQEFPQRYERASPAAWITPAMPPHFLFHGTWDQLVPVEQSRGFHQQLQAAGVPSQLYLMHGHGHFSSFLFRGGAMDQALRFLERHARHLTPDAGTAPATGRE